MESGQNRFRVRGEVGDFREVRSFGLLQIGHGMEAALDERLREGIVDAGQGGHRRHGGGDLVVEGNYLDLIGLDVDVPADELLGEARVLAALADGERKLVFVYENRDAFVGLIDFEPLDFRRLKGFDDKDVDVRAPVDDVHLFVVQLAHDVFYALAAQAHARAHGIHAVIGRMHGELGAPARLAGDGDNFHRAIGDLGDFLCEEFDDEIRVCAGENNFRAASGFFHGLHVATQLLARLIFLNRHPLAVRQQCLVPAEVNDHITAFEAPDGAAHDVAGAVFEFLEDERLLGAPDVLLEILVGVLRGDAAETGGRHLHFNLVAGLGVFFIFHRVEARNLVLLILHAVHYQQPREGADFAGLGIRLHPQIATGAHGFFCRGEDSLVNGLGEGLAADAFFFFVKIQQSQKLRAIYAFIHIFGAFHRWVARHFDPTWGTKKPV